MTTLYKYPAEVRDNYTFNGTPLLAPGELIASINSITVTNPDDSGLVIDEEAVNAVALTFPNGVVVAIGCGAVCRIAAGVIPAGAPYLDCDIQAEVVTTNGNVLILDGILRLINSPGSCC